MGEKVSPSATWPSISPVSQVTMPKYVSIKQVFILTFRTTQLLFGSKIENKHLMNPLLYLD
jgi:hypothetical protein